MTPELKYLAWTSILSALIWIPYVINILTSNRMSDAVGCPDSPLVMGPNDFFNCAVGRKRPPTEADQAQQ